MWQPTWQPVTHLLNQHTVTNVTDGGVFLRSDYIRQIFSTFSEKITVTNVTDGGGFLRSDYIRQIFSTFSEKIKVT